MKFTKECPKCNSKEIYTNEANSKIGERGLLPVSSWRSAYVAVYVCVKCGYFEEYIADSEFEKGKMIENIKTNWGKV
jgi:predicted nucleic-acid-binding Zn-ribbon protein